MKRPHDSKIGWQMVKRNLDKLTILTADKEYDWWLLHHRLRAQRMLKPSGRATSALRGTECGP